MAGSGTGSVLYNSFSLQAANKNSTASAGKIFMAFIISCFNVIENGLNQLRGTSQNTGV
jgi:hypothetical protein